MVQHLGIARVEPFGVPQGIGDAVAERGDVAHAEIEALCRNRVQPVRGIAYQDAARGRQPHGFAQNQRVGGTFANARQRAEPVTECVLQFRKETLVVERQHALGVVLRNRPDKCRAFIGDRQQSKRPLRRETLVGTIL